MVWIRISSNDEKQIEEITQDLLKAKLIIDANIERKVERWVLKDGEIGRTQIYIVTAKTKSLLFTSIDQRLRDSYKNSMPEVYCLPIVHMDWEQAEQLTKHIVLV